MECLTELTDSNFDITINTAELPVLVDFWSPTCVPCRALVPVLEELAKENEDEAIIAKINTALYPELMAKFDIERLPTLLLFHQGKVVERMVGVQSKEKLQAALDELF